MGKDKRRQKESNASRLPLLQTTVRNTLALIHLGGVFGGLEGEARGGQRLEVSAVVLVGLLSIRKARTKCVVHNWEDV